MKNWNDLEFEMVLFFYFSHRNSIPSLEKKDPELINLAKRINFAAGNNRTLDSIYMRLQNYKYIDPLYNGRGLPGGANQCRIYWNKYFDNQNVLKNKYISFLSMTNNAINSVDLVGPSKSDRWTELEMKICLYLYLKYSCNINKNSDLFKMIVDKLNSVTNKNRTLDSIYMRLQNYKFVDPNENGGLSGGAKQCQPFWNAYSDKFEELEKVFYDELINIVSSNDLEEFDSCLNDIISDESSSDIIDNDAYIESIINVRNPLFQRHFKNGLLIEFDCKCALCDINIRELLVASHILPYSKCVEKKSMISPHNGLLLCSLHDSLFDKRLITFENTGRIIISKKVDENIWELLGINDNCFLKQKYLNPERIKYIKQHRKLFFDDEK